MLQYDVHLWKAAKDWYVAYKRDVTISGFGVIKKTPWHLAGVFHTKTEAEKKAAELGPDYEVQYGENRKDLNDFISLRLNP
jgi:hypothetical protein